MKLVASLATKLALKLGLSDAAASGVRRVAVTAAFQGLAAAVAYMLASYAEIGLSPAWGVVVGALLQGADKALRERDAE